MYTKFAKRALLETRTFWSIHRKWTFAAGPISSVIWRGASQGWHVLSADLPGTAGAAIVGFAIAWGGSYLINLIRVPALIVKEKQAEIDELRHTRLKVQSAEFISSDGKSRKHIESLINSYKREGIAVTVSSDGFEGCDPAHGDVNKYLELTYYFGDEGPFTITRNQSPHRLVLPQDGLLLETIEKLKGALKGARTSLHLIEQAGTMTFVAYEAERLANSFLSVTKEFKERFPVPLDQSVAPDAELAVLRRLYAEHFQHTCSATSGVDFRSDVRLDSNPADRNWQQVVKMLRDNKAELDAQAAILREGILARATIS